MVLLGLVFTRFCNDFILINPVLSICNDLISIALFNHIFRDNCFGPVILRPVILNHLTVGMCVSRTRLGLVILTHYVINM